ncbi:hypothetical protein MaudCBS49596_000258 [Microsporum audouinii]
MASETSGGFTGGLKQTGRDSKAGTAGAGATDPTRAGGATRESAQGMGHGVKSAAAGIRGMGEKIRGKAGAVVDRAMHDPEGVAENQHTMRQGEREMHGGDFSHSTREREGLPHSEREVHSHGNEREGLPHSERELHPHGNEREGLPHSERDVNTHGGAGNARPPPEYY